MRYSDLFGKTRRDAPSEITDPARRLALRAGLMRVLDGGETVYLPLAARVLARMGTELRGGLHELGAQELRVRSAPDPSALAAQEIQSYKQLPARLFWFDAGATRFHVASIEENANAAEETLRHFAAFADRFFEWMQVPNANAEDLESSRIWYTPASVGDLELLRCSNGDYTATSAAARPNKPPANAEDLLALQEVATPHCDTIDSLAQFLGVPTRRTAKAVFYWAEGKVIFAVVRGDLQIDEEKLRRALGLSKLRFATEDEIQRVGASPGYASPVGVRDATIVVDDSISNSPNLVAGANREGFHLLNTNVPRDFEPAMITDIALARVGDLCPSGDGKLELARGISLARAGKPSELEANFLDAGGRAQRPFGGDIEIDLAQALIAYVGVHCDAKGILWNGALAPFSVHIVVLNADKPEVAAALAIVTDELERAGVDYMLDDRAESAGVKFNDADLIGLPVRLTLGPRTVAQNAIEVKRRDESAGRVVPLDQVISSL
jgi:prolyl-tRNA synthetase